ncbi:SSS family solute:Na+ symporter [Ereboglobus sp. PH5-10]|uniref:sodium:solute symporter family transporter n=1 Tax=Ereboglobus sp. PH5-10 TaxID=2940629 RepID=UPI0024067794|nr:sodium/solute symporter [Ereboglobus sp. PH5-10]MDF9826044.1 SSS family solute:Na+ symporter [Ereboglobus sp. PH5-10]
MSTLDIVLFFVAVISVIGFGTWKGIAKSKNEPKGASSYFLAGRGLTWWLVGFSLIAANISTEQFVGMSGQAADWLGLAIASYEWLAAVTLVVVAFLFLPKLLRAGIYTVPEFLEHRYGVLSRTIMAIVTMVILVGVPTASVIFAGSKVITVFFQGTTILGLDIGNITVSCWIIGISAAVYVFVGGLRACAWTDLIWGSALIAGGALVLVLALSAIGQKDPAELIATKVATSDVTVAQLADAGPIERLTLLNSGAAMPGENGAGGKFHMVRPASDPAVPWTALLIGLWIPNFFYWGLNQYIMQRTLGSKSLAEGQKGIMFAAFLKLLIPFVVIIPGILAFNLYSGDLREQADIKNRQVLVEFQSGKSEKVFPFTENFAKRDTATALALASHNAAKAGAPLEVGAAPTATEIFAANTNLVAAANKKGVSSATKIVGYDYDAAYGTLLKNLLKPGYTWFVLAALFGAVVSSLAAMLNSASTIFTMDIFHKLAPRANEKVLVNVGKACTLIFVGIACVIAPGLGSPKYNGIFTFIQEFQGFISPGVLGVFLFGFLVHKAPRYLGWLGIVINAVLYGALKIFTPEIAFLNRMAICFGVVIAVLAICTLVNPLKEPVKMPVNTAIALETSPGVKKVGIGIVLLTIVLYIIFW